MESAPKKFLKVRVHEGKDPSNWELFAPDGTPIDGWYLISVGRDHSGRFALHVILDQFECVDADGQLMDVQLVCPTAKPHDTSPPLPPPGLHKRGHE